MQFVFLLCLFLGAGVIAFGRGGGVRAKRGVWAVRVLALLLAAGFVGVCLAQAQWQVWGFRDVRFVRFYSRYNKRVESNAPRVVRGAILDWRGRVLVAPDLNDDWNRRSLLGIAGVHPIGYFNRQYGLSGVERVLDVRLLTVPQGVSAGVGKKLLEAESVSLSLDARLQGFAYDCLEGRRGAVVVARPQTGELLALVSSPGFDPGDVKGAWRDDAEGAAFNRALQGLYPPGSAFKVFVAALAAEQGKSWSFACPGEGWRVNASSPWIRDSEFYAAQREGRSWKGWGRIGLEDALVHSSNVFFAQLGVALGGDVVASAAERLFAPFVVLACGEASMGTARPVLPDFRAKPGQLAYGAIGQGEVLLTPLHVALLTGAVANGGVLQPPSLEPVKRGEKQNGVRLFSEAAARKVAGYMRQAVVRGTGRGADVAGLSVCGKTGTAQTKGEDHAWFTCFAPERNPQLVVTVLVEHGGFGAAAAVPVAKKVLVEAKRLKLVD